MKINVEVKVSETISEAGELIDVINCYAFRTDKLDSNNKDEVQKLKGLVDSSLDKFAQRMFNKGREYEQNNLK